MRGVDTIVLGYDFSDSAGHAARAAFDLVKASDASLVVVTALPNGVDKTTLEELKAQGYSQPGQAKAAAFEEYAGTVRDDIEALGLPKGIDVQYDVSEATPERAVLVAARDYDAGLVVLGAVGKNVAAHPRAIGTDTFRIVRHCPVPVLVVRRDSQWPPSTILVGTDLSNASRCAFESAVDIAEDTDATVHVLQVTDDDGSELSEWLQTFETRDVEVVHDTADGHPVDVLTMRGSKHDLVALGSIGRSAFMEFLLGGTSERVLKHVPASMLLVKPDEFSITRKARS